MAWGDAAVANSARAAAKTIHEITQNETGKAWFEGHWGFQYYMESFEARPVNVRSPKLQLGDFLAEADNNGRFFDVQPRFVAMRRTILIGVPIGVTTMQKKLGAGFYSSLRSIDFFCWSGAC